MSAIAEPSSLDDSSSRSSSSLRSKKSIVIAAVLVAIIVVAIASAVGVVVTSRRSAPATNAADEAPSDADTDALPQSSSAIDDGDTTLTGRHKNSSDRPTPSDMPSTAPCGAPSSAPSSGPIVSNIFAVDDGKMVPSPIYSAPFEFLSTDPDGVYLDGLKAKLPRTKEISIFDRRLPFTMKWLGPFIYDGIDQDLWQTVCAVNIGSPGYIYVRGWRDCIEDQRSTRTISQANIYVAMMRLLPEGVVWWKETADRVIISWENATRSRDYLKYSERWDPTDPRRLVINAQIHLHASGRITICYGPSNWADINNGNTTYLTGVSVVKNAGNNGFWGASGSPYFANGEGVFLPRHWPTNKCQDYWLDRNAPNSKGPYNQNE